MWQTGTLFQGHPACPLHSLEVVTAMGTAWVTGFAGVRLSVLQPHVVGVTTGPTF